MRKDLSWLPAAGSIALSLVEHHGGVKVIYDDGHVLEFGIASVESLRGWSGNAVRVLVDKGGVTEAVAAMVAKPLPTGERDDARDVRLVCTQVLIGVGRSRRGELLSAGQSVRAEAVAALLTVLGNRLPGERHLLDNLDPRRRFERVHPELAARIGAALEQDVERAARALIDIAQEHLAPDWDQFPHRGVAAVRRRLAWD